MLDRDILINEFKLHFPYYIHFRTYTFGTSMNFLIPSALLIPLSIFYKDVHGIYKPQRLKCY